MVTGPSAEERYVLDYYEGARAVTQSVEIASWEATDGVLTAVTPTDRTMVLSPPVEWVIEPAEWFEGETDDEGWSLEDRPLPPASPRRPSSAAPVSGPRYSPVSGPPL